MSTAKLNVKQRFGEADGRPSDRDLELYYRNRICFEPIRKLADEIGLSKSAVGEAIVKAAPWYLSQHVIDDEAMRKEQTAQLVRLAEEAAEQWERSKLDIETHVESTTTGEKGSSKDEKKTQGRYGDARLADVIRNCLKDIRDIWGLDAPKKSETGAPGSFDSRESLDRRIQEKLTKLTTPKEN